ncbi:MAG: DUF6263 family protein [Planctomycetota bacterium]
MPAWRWPVLVMAVAALASALLAAGVGPARAQTDQGGIDLRPRWTPGQAATFEFVNLRSSTSSLELPDRTIDADFEIRSEGQVRWVVDRVEEDGSARCTMTLEWMSATLVTPDGQTLTNDTRKGSGDDPTMHGLLKAMASKALTITVAADGTVTAVDGLKAMRDAADDAEMVPDEVDFNETATELAVISGVPGLIAVGDDWSVEHTWNYGIVGMDVGSLDQEWTYTLEGVETIEGVAVAVVRGEADRIKLDASAVAEQQPEGMPDIGVRLTDASATSQVLFDLSRREAVGRYGTLATTLELRIPLPNGQTIRRTVTETIEGTTVRMAEE